MVSRLQSGQELPMPESSETCPDHRGDAGEMQGEMQGGDDRGDAGGDAGRSCRGELQGENR